jgi:hypothetical protein
VLEGFVVEVEGRFHSSFNVAEDREYFLGLSISSYLI